MAKNMATHGNWGVNAGEFQSASSSPLWVLLLSFLYLVFGVNVITPFLMNIVFVTLTVVAAYFILRQTGDPAALQLPGAGGADLHRVAAAAGDAGDGTQPAYPADPAVRLPGDAGLHAATRRVRSAATRNGCWW